MEEYCVECIEHGIWKRGQGHHVVHRSKAKYMEHVPMNMKPLCLDHHTGNLGVHHHPEVDRKYKEELQLQFTLLLTKDYYTHTELKKILNISDNTVKAITKTLPRYKEGYKNTNLIFRMMGDENYL
jgi:hypothetical protein